MQGHIVAAVAQIKSSQSPTLIATYSKNLGVFSGLLYNCALGLLEDGHCLVLFEDVYIALKKVFAIIRKNIAQ
jgi:hypothetical protein